MTRRRAPIRRRAAREGMDHQRDQDGIAQSRVLLVWNRIIFPNGNSVVLKRQPGADASGYAGLEDGVDYHWLRLAGTANSFNQSGQQIVQRNLNLQPTLTIRPGFPVRVIVTRDLVLAPYGSPSKIAAIELDR